MPAPPSALSTSLSTQTLGCSSLSPFLRSSSSACIPQTSHFSNKRFASIAHPSLLAQLCQLLTDIPPQTYAAETYRTHFSHNTRHLLIAPRCNAPGAAWRCCAPVLAGSGWVSADPTLEAASEPLPAKFSNSCRPTSFIR